LPRALRDGGVGFCQFYLLSWQIRIFHPWDGKSLLAQLRAVSGTDIFVPYTVCFKVIYSVWGPNHLREGNTVMVLT